MNQWMNTQSQKWVIKYNKWTWRFDLAVLILIWLDLLYIRFICEILHDIHLLSPAPPALPHILMYVKMYLPSSLNYASACVICNLANLSHLAVNKVRSILSDLFLHIWLVVGHCEGEGDPLSLYSLSKTNGSECWQNKQHNVSSDTSIFLGCHRWVSVTGGNNWVFTRRHFYCVLKYQPLLGILGGMEFL